jgi:hypothetical protein
LTLSIEQTVNGKNQSAYSFCPENGKRLELNQKNKTHGTPVHRAWQSLAKIKLNLAS